MRFLIVHQHFPGQFSHISAELAHQGHEVFAIGESRYLTQRRSPHPNVHRFGYEMPKMASGTSHAYLSAFETHVIRGQAVIRGCLNLKQKGFYPDIVLAHPGWGEALFLKDAFPDARHIHFCEFFYHAAGADVGYDDEFPVTLNDRLRVRVKNATQLIGLEYADAGVSPTYWQASRFPAHFRPKIEVIHEGIDTAVVSPNASAKVNLGDRVFSASDEVITYVARNLEPYRGFHILTKMLPELLARRPNAQVLIVGGDSVSYGPNPSNGKTWREHCFDPIRHRVDTSRIHFMGRLPYADYLSVLRISSAHLYLTYPFVLSWSMLEAMATECLVIGSANAPVQECLVHEKNGLLCDFFDIEAWVDSVERALTHREEMKPLRRQARLTILEHYDLTTIGLPGYLKFLLGTQ